MSNIPSSAIPHAWARDDLETDRDERQAAPGSPSLAMLAGLGALFYLVYRTLR